MGSAICLPMVIDGFSEDIESWKIIAMRSPRMARISSSLSLSRSLPSNRISPFSMRPGGEGMRRRIDIEVTLLPEPDSPTMASVSPAATSKEMLSTAVTTPRSVLNRVVRFLT